MFSVIKKVHTFNPLPIRFKKQLSQRIKLKVLLDLRSPSADGIAKVLAV